MLSWQDDEMDLAHELALAQGRLDRFERQQLGRRPLVRLRLHRPFHPVLLLRAVFLLASVVLALGTLTVLLVPVYGDRELTAMLSRLDEATLPLPVALALLFACGGLLTLGAHLAAVVVGRSAPLLPDQAREHQRLEGDVTRLTTMVNVSDRRPPGAVHRGYLGGQATIPMSANLSDAPTVLDDGNMVFGTRRR